MKNRLRFLLPTGFLTIAVMILSFNVVFAEDKSNIEKKPNDFAARVAIILGMDEKQVSDAMEQARQELKKEFLEHKFAVMVEKGILTEEEAKEKMEWIKANPKESRWLFHRDKGRNMIGTPWRDKHQKGYRLKK